MTAYTVPEGQEPHLEEIFEALRTALRVYRLQEIVVQEDGLAWFGHGYVWANSAYRDDCGGLTLDVGAAARDMMPSVYRREGCPWYSSTWRLNQSGERSWEWDLDSRPRFGEPSRGSPSLFLEDLATFPRADHLVPLWMRPALAAAGAWDPASDKLTLGSRGRPDGKPVYMDQPDVWYLLPIRDCPDGPRRAFGPLPLATNEASHEPPSPEEPTRNRPAGNG